MLRFKTTVSCERLLVMNFNLVAQYIVPVFNALHMSNRRAFIILFYKNLDSISAGHLSKTDSRGRSSMFPYEKEFTVICVRLWHYLRPQKLGFRVNALSLFSVLSADFFIAGPERMIKSEIWDLPR